MLQKLLIALCTIFVLSACGGDLDLGPENPPPQDGNTDQPDDGDEDEEPGEPQIYTDIQFEEEASAETWSYRCVDGCNSTAELSFNAEEEVLAIEPEWAGDEDHLEVYTSVDEIFDMEGAAASAWVYVTEDYVTDGNLSMQLLLSNASGATAYTRPVLAASEGWQRLQVWEMATTTEVDEDEEVEETEEEPAEDYGSFEEYSEGFDLRNINEVGVRFSANGKAVDVNGQLWIDNVVLTPGPTKEIAPLVVDMDSSNWTLQDGGSLSLQRGDGTVFFNPDGTQQYSPKLAYMLSGPIDLTGLSITVVFSVDEAYIASGGNINAFVQENFGSYQGNLDGDSVCQIANDDLVAGEETEYVCSDLPDTSAAEEGEQLRVGVQADGSDGVVTVHSLEIEGAGGPVEVDPATEAPMDSGWRVNPGSLEFNYTDEGVYYAPTAEDDQLVHDFSGPQEFAGAQYTFVITVDQAFIDSGAELQPFFQRTDDYSIGNYCNNVTSADLVAGEDYEVTCGPLNGDFDYDESGSTQVGLQTKGSAIAGTVTIKSLTIQ